jgi:zinc protease
VIGFSSCIEIDSKVTLKIWRRLPHVISKPANRTLGLFVPTLKPVAPPATPDLTAALKDYKGDAAVATGEAFDPSPGNIESRLTRSDAGGIKLALLPKKTRGGKVVAQMLLRYGDEKSLMNRSGAADLAGGMLMRGTSKHTRQQIQDELDRLGAPVYFRLSNGRGQY